ncbi:hypothetical protein QQS21_006859 [Conoideocrella luteorostrata]|uniref:Protein kinase domain-containing protein n=1 Tax=Conoideocrella luteorostrata TaxID=1105319 RepID=A0AAJ0CM05_9HYPO|nr:hypothetical protein QQS21_006859 [Conoideocrella luteorostrata]
MDFDHVNSVLPAPAWTMLEFTFSIENTDAKMVALCNGRRVDTYLFAENFTQSPSLKEKYLFFLQVAENFELEGYTVEDFYDWIAEPLLPIFCRLSALQKPLNRSLFAVPYYEEESDHSLFGINIPENTYSPWPTYEPPMIQPCDSSATGPHPSCPAKVLLPDGSSAFLKLMRPGDRGFLLNELAAYSRIRDSSPDTSLRISRLLGLVRNEGNKVFGLLLTYIDCERRTLSCAVNRDTEATVRRRWAKQIEDTIVQLHRAGIVWGDAKPDNVLIDRKNNAWLVDFGDSYTEGWVPKGLSGTVEGDLAALGKIKDFIEGT